MKVPEPRKLPSGSWYIQLRLNGESISITEATKAECKKRAELIKAEHRNGKRAPKQKAEEMTIGEILDAYISDIRATASPSTIKGIETIRKNRFESVIDTRFKDVTNWQTVIDSASAVLAPKTIKNSWTCLNTAAKRKGLALPPVRLPAIPRNEHDFLAFDEIPVFLEAIRGDKAEIGALILLHSFRLSEACAMDWSTHIDLKRRTLRAKGAYVQGSGGKYYLNETNKNASSQRYVPIMIDRLYELLNEETSKTGRVIKMAPETLQRRIDRACLAAGLPKVGAHGLRHSFASLAHHLGFPEHETMRLGGWSDHNTMRKIYTHIAEKDHQRHLNAMTLFYKNADKNADENPES